LPRVDQVGGVGKQRLRAQVKVVSREVSRGWLLYRRFFTRSDFGLKLISDCLRDFTLDSEDVIQRSVVILCPQMRVGASVDELRVHSYFVAGALHAAFEYMGYAKLLPNLPQVTRGAALVWQHAAAADHLQVRDPGQLGQDLILHTISEKGILLIGAQVRKREDSDAFLRNGRNRSGSRRRKACSGALRLRGAMAEKEDSRCTEPGDHQQGQHDFMPWYSLWFDDRTRCQRGNPAKFRGRIWIADDIGIEIHHGNHDT